MEDPESLFGGIDIYLLDQVLRGRIRPGMSILETGCGRGRNLRHFLREGYEVWASDKDPAAVEALRTNFRCDWGGRLRVEAVEDSTFDDGCADVVLSIAVLHFAQDRPHFELMLGSTWRLLKPGGLFFCRLASLIGMEARCAPLGHGRFRLPDGTDRFLVDAAQLLSLTETLGGTLLDPLKTTLVQDQRAMTTWVLRKH